MNRKPLARPPCLCLFLCALLGALAFTEAALGAPKTVTVKVRVDSEAPGYEGFRAMDGNPQTMWHTDWMFSETKHPHEMIVDLGATYEIAGFSYLPREGGGNGTIKEYECYVSDSDKDFGKPLLKDTVSKGNAENVVTFPATVKGRYVKLVGLSEVNGRPWTSIAELQILVDGVQFKAEPVSGASPLLAEWAKFDEVERQWRTLLFDLRNRNHFARVAPQVFRPAALILESDRDPVDVVLRRTAVLLGDLKQMPSAPDLRALEGELRSLQAANADTPVDDADARLALFRRVCAVRRQIAFSNPLLDFGKLLFIKRHRSVFNHMCDQYYGVTAQPGGGVYVLSDAFGVDPQLRDVLADSVAKRGRLTGQKLTGGPTNSPPLQYDGVGTLSGPETEGGSFLSPDLSYDGKTILFAYVECKGDRAHRHHTDPTQGHWAEGRCYHLFRANADGSGLEQLTDGTWNDFDPCWLPDGRVAFITERRGGYLRCGRVCPTYTLFDMNADGSGIRCLSFHETNEWNPGVTADGRIIYTRWDYVDRFGCTAHLPWITTPDGCDSRAVHGNFAPRQLRPDMELDVQAIPGSTKYVATAAPHHGQAFGSLVIIDPTIEDDDAMAPVKRLTPEVGFPESQGGSEAYATAWPLSEDYYLCAYDAAMAIRVPGAQGRYGLYLVDSFGNRELLYRDPDIGCQNPVPVRPRPMPPVYPSQAKNEQRTEQPARRAQLEPAEGTVALVNVYDSLKPWPQGTRIAALRVLQILPMTAPSGRHPHEIGLREPSARDSVLLARYVLGTVPVEPDGSAHFTVPAEKEMFFQALDDKGLAVQSMRSATYLQAGERLLCQGCHEPKMRAVKLPERLPLAMQRKPSTLKPDVDGSNPFSYPRLVQPVLDRHCVGCHAKSPDKAPNLGREPVQNHWYASYNSLAPNYGFYDYHDGHRTTPGQFGAYASKLYQMLQAGHHDVKLPAEDLHRLSLWLDCCSIFYGVYEKEGGEAQLRGEIVRPTLE
jgi:hypothetical protein